MHPLLLDQAAIARKALLADTANIRTAVDGVLVEAASVQLLSSVQLLVLKDVRPMWYCVAQVGTIRALVGALRFLCRLHCVAQPPVPVGVIPPSEQLAALHAADGSVQCVDLGL